MNEQLSEYTWRPTFRLGTILSGFALAFGIQMLLQQAGVAQMTGLIFFLAILLGGLAGLFWSWAAHAVAVARANGGA